MQRMDDMNGDDITHIKLMQKDLTIIIDRMKETE